MPERDGFRTVKYMRSIKITGQNDQEMLDSLCIPALSRTHTSPSPSARPHHQLLPSSTLPLFHSSPGLPPREDTLYNTDDHFATSSPALLTRASINAA